MMAVYKVVELFGQFADDASTSAFPQWQTKVRIALKRHFPSSVKFVSKSDQDLTDELARQVAAASSVDAGRQLCLDHEEANVDAAGHLLLFHAEFTSPFNQEGSKAWGFLEEQHDVSMVQAVLEGIEQEFPEWTVLLQGLQGGLTGRETIADIQPDLVRLDVKLRRTVDSGHRAVAMRANAAGSQTSDHQALEARVEQLSAQLRTLQTQIASQPGQQRSVPGTQRRER
jgi:hypothetical protein